jgi:hypothetical protein
MDTATIVSGSKNKANNLKFVKRSKGGILGICVGLLSALLASVIVFYGCKKDDIGNNVSLRENKSVVSADPWDGCNAKVHPYSLGNIRDAKDELDLNSPIDPNKILQYVCIFINNDVERDLLNGLMGNVSGNSYSRVVNIPMADPALYQHILTDIWCMGRDTVQHFQYAILPIDTMIPTGLSYVFLDTLYFPNEATEAETENLDLGAQILAGAIEVDSMDVVNYYLNNSQQKGLFSWLKKAVSYIKNVVVGVNPSGYVTMNGSPMWGTTVDVIAWGLPHRATTSSNGYFYINTRIHVGTIVYLSFENSHCNINLWNLETWYNINNITLTALYYVGAKTASNIGGMTINLDNNSHGGFCATITDAVERYRQLAQQMGIGIPPKVYITAIWGRDFSKGEGCAPMANYLMTPTNFVPDFLQPALQITTNLLGPFGKLLPDIIIPAKKGFNAESITATTLHEYTHAAHAHLAGKNFWLNVVAGEISNMIKDKDPYGYKATSAPEVGVAEAWAYSVEYYMMYLLTGNTDRYIDKIENHYTKPTNAISIHYWIPKGLYFDLYDKPNTYLLSNGTFITEQHIMDEVSGISWKDMYHCLAGVNDFKSYKNKIIQQYPAQKTAIDALFNEYSY